MKLWRQKIYLALAKQYAINGAYGNAIAYYDKCIDAINKKNPNVKNDENQLTTTTNNDDLELLVEILQDKSKIEQNKGNLERAVDILKDAISVAKTKYTLFFLFDFSIFYFSIIYFFK